MIYRGSNLSFKGHQNNGGEKEEKETHLENILQAGLSMWMSSHCLFYC